MGNTVGTQTDSIGTVASDIANVNTVASNLSTIAQKATVDEATALAIAVGLGHNMPNTFKLISRVNTVGGNARGYLHCSVR